MHTLTDDDRDDTFSTSVSDPTPTRLPLLCDEMSSLLRHLQSLQTNLLWLSCDWIEQARHGELSNRELEANAHQVFANMEQRFLAHLQTHLTDAPTVLVADPRPLKPGTADQ